MWTMSQMRSWCFMQKGHILFLWDHWIINVLSISQLLGTANHGGGVSLYVLSAVRSQIEISKPRHSRHTVQVPYIFCTKKVDCHESCENRRGDGKEEAGTFFFWHTRKAYFWKLYNSTLIEINWWVRSFQNKPYWFFFLAVVQYNLNK